MRWAFEDPARFLHEQEELQKLAVEGWLTYAWRTTPEAGIEVDLDFTVHDRVFAGCLTYPEMFPNALPFIRPRDSLEVWSGHQYGVGGALCLEWRADNWHPGLTGADIVRSAHKLLSTEQHPTAPQRVPSAHRNTPGQLLRQQRSRLVVTPDLINKLAMLPFKSASACATVTVLHASSSVRFVSEVTVGDSTFSIDDVPQGIYESLPLFSWRVAGWIFRSESWTGVDDLESTGQLIETLAAADLDTACLSGLAEAKGSATMVVLAGDSVAPTVAYIINADEPTVLKKVSIVRSGASANRIPEEAQRLATVRIGIVGLGSIGSKMAVSLARSGVRKFLLVDDDVFLGENVVRHELDWASVGVHKVAAMHERLSLIAPNIDVTARTQRVDGQESPLQSAAALKELGECDLIIDATADPHVFLMLAGVARSAKKPLVWAEVFAGGYGGLIARARPDLDPNPHAMRDGLIDYYSKQPPAPFREARDYDDTGETPQVAYDSEVGFVATAAIRLALDTVLQKSPSDFPNSAYLLGLRKEWIFEAPFDTRPVAIEGPGWTFEKEAISPELIQQAIVSILSITPKTANGQNPADG